ncbi:hypothetical protein CPLU01_09413 [Colletotrichum plurivorum]|uniref:Uncharacterized protein n=1 Tax=Colletotrichum plurivorum TaxID=2175906 RepID=A0A8H6K8Y2_9PEZI|nr:hypothetical protein CPLU01_09413 [Colletotrichum plurivorum]
MGNLNIHCRNRCPGNAGFGSEPRPRLTTGPALLISHRPPAIARRIRSLSLHGGGGRSAAWLHAFWMIRSLNPGKLLQIALIWGETAMVGIGGPHLIALH